MAAELKARLTLNNSQFLRGLRGSLASGKRFGAELAASGFRLAQTGMVALTAATAAAGVGLAIGAKRAYDLGGRISDLATRTGIAADQIVILQRVFANAGVSQDALQTSIARMQRSLQEATTRSTQAGQALARMGLNAEELFRMSPDQQFFRIGQAIQRLTNPTDRAASAMQIFGRSGAELLTVFADGRQGLDLAATQVGSQARILGENASRFDAVSDRLSGVGVKLQGFFVGIAEAFLPEVEKMLDRLDSIDLAPLGTAAGNALKQGADVFLGILANPKEALSTFGVGLAATVMWAASKLGGALTAGGKFFATNFSGIIQGIGRILLGTLLEVFGEAAASFQAYLEAAVASVSNPARASAMVQKSAADGRAKFFDWLADAAGRESGIGRAFAADADAARATSAAQAGVLSGMNFDDMDVDAIRARILDSGGPRVRMGGQDMSAAELRASGFAMTGLGGAGGGFRSGLSSLQTSGAGIRQGILNPAPIRPRTIGEAQRLEILGPQEGAREIMRMRAEREGTDAANLGLLSEIKNLLTSINQSTEVLK